MPVAKLPTTQEGVRELTFRQDMGALQLLTDVAGSDDEFLRRTAVEVIGNHPQARSLQPVIVKALKDPSGYVVRTACDVVAKCEIFEAHDVVLSNIASVSGATRRAAIRALSVIWNEPDFDVVFPVYQRDVEINVRKEAAWVLRTHASPKTWRTLFDAFSVDELARHRQWACEVAQAFSGAEIVPLLAALGLDPDGHVRKAASRAIKAISTRRG